MSEENRLYASLKALAKSKEQSRLKLAQQLSKVTPEIQEQVLSRGSSSADFQTRRATFALIGEMNQDNHLKYIKQGLLDKNKDVIQMSVWAVGKLKAKQFLPDLIKILEVEEGFKIRKTIIWAFGELREKKVLPLLKNLVRDGSTRLIKGILVCGLKLGELSFRELLLVLDINNPAIEIALKEVSRDSTHIRKAVLQALLQVKDNDQLKQMIQIIPKITFEEVELQKLLNDQRESLRIVAYQAIAYSKMSSEVKKNYLIDALADSSNKIVREAVLQLKDYLSFTNVQQQLNKLIEQHPSPQIKQITQEILAQDQLLQHLKLITPAWGRFLLESLPGLEGFVEQEANYFGISLQIEAIGNGWLEIKLDNRAEQIEQLRYLHTISRICSIISITATNQQHPQIERNPYLRNEQQSFVLDMEQLEAIELEQIELPSAHYQMITLYSEKMMHRPKRRTNQVSLDWRVARAINLCASPEQDESEIVLDPTCGTATILLDRAIFGPYQKLMGGDLEQEVIQIAERNLVEVENVELQAWDAAALPVEDASVDILVANLPFGRRVGHHELNVGLYPKLVKEIYRIVKHGGKIVLFTQEVQLLLAAFKKYQREMKLVKDVAVQMGGLTPHILCWEKQISH